MNNLNLITRDLSATPALLQLEQDLNRMWDNIHKTSNPTHAYNVGDCVWCDELDGMFYVASVESNGLLLLVAYKDDLMKDTPEIFEANASECEPFTNCYRRENRPRI